MLGSLGEVIFAASNTLLRTFKGMQRSGSPRVAEHEVIARKAVPEFLAPANESISFQMRFDRAYGVNPSQELRRLRNFRDTGKILPLAIGGEYMGQWYIASLGESHNRHDGKGRLLVAEVDVQLKEVPTAAGSQSYDRAQTGVAMASGEE